MTPDQNNDRGPEIDRRLALQLDRALQGLDPLEAAELAGLSAPGPDAADLTIDLAAAAVDLARVGATGHPGLPPGLAARLVRQADRLLDRDRPLSAPGVTLLPIRPRGRVAPWLGWAVAAGALAVVVYDRATPAARPAVAPRWPIVTSAPPDLLAAAPATRLVATAHPLAVGSGGTVAWDEGRQEGRVRIEGLAPVDPRTGCYQLWIFDETRDARYPVDGGTFTVDGPAGARVVAVHPRVSVRSPTMFAITLEPPGGVVVSDRERVLLTAAWPPSGGGGPPRR